MADYIERKAVLDAIGKAMPSQSTPDFKGVKDYEAHIACEAFADAATIVEKLPAANVREDVQGEWVLENTREKSYMRVCSVCKRTAYCCTPVFSYCFCPNCGARMTGGGER